MAYDTHPNTRTPFQSNGNNNDNHNIHSVLVSSFASSLAVNFITGDYYLGAYPAFVYKIGYASPNTVTVVAGCGTGGTGNPQPLCTSVTNGGAATSSSIAGISAVTSLAVDPNGDLYIATGDHYTVRKVFIATGIITTVAGTGVQGTTLAVGPATSVALGQVVGIVVQYGHVYVLDATNSGLWPSCSHPQIHIRHTF